MNYFYRTPSIYQPTNLLDASTSSSSAISAWDWIAASGRMPQYVRTVIAPSVGEVSGVNPLWNSVPVEVIQQEPFSPSAVGDVHINWLETMNAHVVKADVPGMRRQDLQVLVEGGPVLQISGERFETWPFDNVNRRQVERWIGGFMRRFRLPDSVIIDRISAELDLGVLTITIPKLQRIPSVQWFIPIRTTDSGRSSAEGSLTDAFPPQRASSSGRSSQAEGSMTDAFPPLRASSSNEGTNNEDQGQSRLMPARISLVEVDENSLLSKHRASQRRITEASSKGNSARSRDSQTEEDVPGPVTARATTDLESDREPAKQPEGTEESPEEPEVDESTEEAVKMVLESILQALEADQTVTNRTKRPSQSRRKPRSINTSNSLSQRGSRTAQRRASQITNTGATNDLTTETSVSTRGLLETLGNALQRKISQSSFGYDRDPDEGQDREVRTTGSRSSRIASQTTENSSQGRNSRILSDKDTQPVIDQGPESGTTVTTRSFRPASQTDEHDPQQQRSSQSLPENAPQLNDAPQINASQDKESASSLSGRASRLASWTDENARQRRNSQSLTENNTEPNVGEDIRSRPADSRRPSRRAYTDITDTTSRKEASVPIENSPNIRGNASPRTSQTGDNDTQQRPSALDTLQ